MLLYRVTVAEKGTQYPASRMTEKLKKTQNKTCGEMYDFPAIKINAYPININKEKFSIAAGK